MVEEGHVDPTPLCPDRAARLLARRGGVHMAAGARNHELFRPRRARPGHPRDRRTDALDRGRGPVMLTVDVDVLDPAFAPGTGTPEPGGLTSTELLLATRLIAAHVDLVGADVVEVAPTAVGSAHITALVANASSARSSPESHSTPRVNNGARHRYSPPGARLWGWRVFSSSGMSRGGCRCGCRAAAGTRALAVRVRPGLRRAGAARRRADREPDATTNWC